MTRLQNVLNTFEHLVSFSKPRVMTVGELIDQGVLDLRMGRPKDRYEGTPAKLRERIVTAADVRDDTLRELGIDEPDWLDLAYGLIALICSASLAGAGS